MNRNAQKAASKDRRRSLSKDRDSSTSRGGKSDSTSKGAALSGGGPKPEVVIRKVQEAVPSDPPSAEVLPVDQSGGPLEPDNVPGPSLNVPCDPPVDDAMAPNHDPANVPDPDPFVDPVPGPSMPRLTLV